MTRKTAKSRVWFFPTSPRSPYKLKGELALLKSVSGMPWSRQQGQAQFVELLKQDPGYEGAAQASDTTFPARDRTRGPKMLGLIEVKGRGVTSRLSITEAGEKLLSLTDEFDDILFLNQVAKVQFPSAQHNSADFLEMNCRPLTITLKFMIEVGPITKEEFGLFVLPTVKPELLGKHIQALSEFRMKISSAHPGLPRKTLRSQLVDERVAEIYAPDIEAGNTLLREGGDNFIKTKRQTLTGDYADSSFRYLLATGLFRIDQHGKTFSIVPSRMAEASGLVSELGLASTFSNYLQDGYVTQYLGSLNEPGMSSTSKEAMSQLLNDLLDAGNFFASDKAQIMSGFEDLSNGVDRAVLCRSIESEQRSINVRERAASLVRNREEVSDQVNAVFAEIVDRSAEIIDRPLMLEWNTWRALTVLNDAVAVTGNFRTDVEGNPLGHAAGNQADIVVEYEDFWLAVEVTLQSGARQHETESESITRHVGLLQAKRKQEGDSRPVFGLFIAPKVNETVVNYILVTSKMNSRVYEGPVRIVPIELNSFQAFISKNKTLTSTSSKPLNTFLSSQFLSPSALSGDERNWLQSVGENISELTLTD